MNMNKYEKLTKPFKLFDKVIDDFNEAAREVTRVFPSIERQVCSLELAKKLKKLEVKQDSLRYWIYCPETKEWVLAQRKWTKNWKMYSAFTVAELGELLPFKIYSNPIPNPFELKINKLENKWEVYYLAYESRELNNTDLCPTISADTEADARAKLVIYLLENNLTKQEG